MVNKRIFISGGAGVIGNALVDKLLEMGANLFVGDLKPCPNKWLGKLKYRQGDLNSITPEELVTFDPEIFFHLAATFERSEESYPFFGDNFHHNVRLSHHLLNCLKDAPSLESVVFASSYLVYDPRLYLSLVEKEHVAPLSEESSIYPRNICGAAKFYHELELHFMSLFQQKATFKSARIFRVYGRGSRDIISRWVRAALQNEKLTVYRPEGKFDYIFADDVAEGLWRLSLLNENAIVNLGSGRARSIYEVIEILRYHFPHLKMEIGSSDIPIECSEAGIQKLEILTGWKPHHDLETGIEKLIEFEKGQPARPAEIHRQHVLITSISKKMPLINTVRCAVAKSGLYALVYGSDQDGSCIGQYGVDEFWRCPALSQLQIDDLLDYCRSHQIGAIIPTRDGELEYFAQHKDYLASKGIAVLVSKATAIKTCLDKLLFAQELSKHRFPAITTCLHIDELNTQKYVVKERIGAGSHSLGLNLTKNAALEHAAKLKEPIFQPFLEGQEWSVDVYRTKNGHVKGVVARQRNVVVGGESQVTTTSAYPVLEQLCHEMADALDVYGHVIFQVIEDSKGDFHVIECNPRFGGASTASVAVGLTSFLWFLMESQDISLDEFPFLRSKHEIKQIRYCVDRIEKVLNE